MKHKSIVVALITVLLCMVLGNTIACTTPVTEYHLTISSTEGGSVTTPGEDKYHYCEEQGDRVNLVATPDPGYLFDEWTGDVSTIADVNDATTTITVNGDYSITANFEEIPEHDGEIPEHDLIISSTTCGYVDTPGEGIYSYAEDTVVNLVAIPYACCQFVKWTAAPEVTFGNETAAATTFTMPASNVTVTAHFKDVCPPTPPAMPPPCSSCLVYGLMIYSTGGGSVTTPGEGAFPYYHGSVVQLVASPDAGHNFLYWSGDVATIDDVYDASTTIIMNDWYIITANFSPWGGEPPVESPVQYDLTTSSTTGGSVTNPRERTFTYDEGETVSLVASPDTGYKFVNWTGDVTTTITNVNDPTTSITMNGDYAITVNSLDPK